MYVVYKHTTPSGKVYIGITGKKPEKRWQSGSGYKQNKHFYRAIMKYGWDNIKHEIVEDGLTKEQACDLEIKLIAEYDSTNPDKGYNHSTGGECSAVGVHHSAETRRKLIEVKKVPIIHFMANTTVLKHDGKSVKRIKVPTIRTMASILVSRRDGKSVKQTKGNHPCGKAST